jgi:hypothetical protein
LDEQELLVLLIAVATLIFKYKRPVPDQWQCYSVRHRWRRIHAMHKENICRKLKNSSKGMTIKINIVITGWQTNSMESCTSWEADSHTSSQELPHLLWNLKVHYFFTWNSLSLDCYPETVGSSPRPHTLFKIHVIIILPFISTPLYWFLSLKFSDHNLYIFISSMHATCCASLIYLHLITLFSSVMSEVVRVYYTGMDLLLISFLYCSMRFLLGCS